MEELDNLTLDFTKRGLKKIEKAPTDDTKPIINLILDQNDLQRLDNIDTYTRVENLSVCNNFLVRMHGVSRLTNIRVLSFNNNGILQIEGLKDLFFLKVLKLAGNNIKSIEHLNENLQLEHLDLSKNQISFISDISYLKNLKHLNLERNRIIDLRQCDRYLPPNLEHLSLGHNNIQDLNEISHLTHLNKLEYFTIQGNPCVAMAGKDKLGFDYRPFVLTWIMSVKSIDGFMVSAIENLKAEWLYSQGKGRQFIPGQHRELCEYLASTCPLTADALETEDQRKLRLILSKAQLHQQQLQEQTHSPLKSRIQSPRTQSRLASRHIGRSPDRLTSSCHSALPNPGDNCNAMSLSYDSTALSHSLQDKTKCERGGDRDKSTVQARLASRHIGRSPDRLTSSCHSALPNPGDNCNAMSLSYDSTALSHSLQDKTKCERGGDRDKSTVQEPITKPTNHSLEAASKMVPVPESLMSPDYHDPMYDLKQNLQKSNHTKESENDNKKTQINNKNVRNSPKLTRSAMSSPKLKTRIERKGSLSNSSDSESNKKSNKIIANGINKVNTKSTTEENDIAPEKLEGIKLASNQRRQKKVTAETSAAVTIQKIWRGYRSRNLNKDTLRILNAIQAARARQHIERLTCDMEATKAALESERKIQQLQMQAINALWKKVSTIQTDSQKKTADDDNTEVLRQLTDTCFNLQSQVVELQTSMQEVLRAVTNKHVASGVSTQTDISAVITPQEEASPWLRRPQTLTILGAAAPAGHHTNTQGKTDLENTMEEINSESINEEKSLSNIHSITNSDTLEKQPIVD